MVKICLITPNHISSNPRLVKEAVALSAAGYDVHIIFSQHTEYLIEEDFKILKSNVKWKYSIIKWYKRDVFAFCTRVISGILQKTAQKLIKINASISMHSVILNRHYYKQLKSAVAVNADLYIAHNAGALAVAAVAAKINGKKFAFDAEDFHRGEVLAIEVINAVVKIENKCLPLACYVSAASPLISLEYKKLFPESKILLINNVFPFANLSKPMLLNHGPLKLFWFSQTIGTNRGIQDIMKAMRLSEIDGLELHLYGYLPKHSRCEFGKLIEKLNFSCASKIFFHNPISPAELLSKSSEFDIGFALEPGFCFNNKIALSNKIFTYLLGGCAIIFTNTPAQSSFFKENSNIGDIYNSSDISSLATILLKYDNNRQLLLNHKANSRKLFENEFNWEKESKKFIEVVKSQLE